MILQSESHLAQVRRVWEKLGKPVFGGTFDQYLGGTDSLEAVPMLPDWPAAWGDSFDRDVLVDGRIVEKVGLKETCRLAGLAYSGEDDTLVPRDANRSERGVRWMRGQAGHKNRNRRPSDCRNSFAAFEVGMEAPEGVFTYVVDSNVIEGHYLDLVGSVRRDGRVLCACLGVIVDGPGLLWGWGDVAYPRCGSASRGSVILNP